MSKTANIFQPVFQRSSSFIGLFFALLLLTGSCPIKQFLKSHQSISVNVKQGSKNNHTVTINKKDSALSCCFSFQEKTLKKASAQQKVHSPHFTFCDYSAEKGFVIHTFLDGTHDTFRTYITPFPSTLPRFLQYRSIIV